MPSVSGNTHEVFENQMIAALIKRGYIVSSATYHETLPAQAVEILQRIYTPAALYLRTRADRIAIRRDLVFEFEVKTHENKRYSDMTIEALPLLHHMMKLNLGVDCLYMYHNPFERLYRGFWVSGMPPIRDFRIPENTRYDDAAVEATKMHGGLLFSAKNIITSPVRGDGSADPYIIIDKADVVRLELLTAILARLDEKP